MDLFFCIFEIDKYGLLWRILLGLFVLYYFYMILELGLVVVILYFIVVVFFFLILYGLVVFVVIFGLFNLINKFIRMIKYELI